MKSRIYMIFLILMFFSTAWSQEPLSKIYPFAMEYNPERTLIRTFPEPPGYERFPANKMTRYMAWLTNLPLKPEHHPVIRYDRQIITRADSIGGVIDIGVTTNNQKDADFPIQLALEYVRASNQIDSFPIIIDNKDTVNFFRWLNGQYSTDARGNLIYKKSDPRIQSGKEFYRFLEFVIRKNTNKTLLGNLAPVAKDEIIPGDIFIQFKDGDLDSLGHCTVVLDVCSNKKGERMFLIGWGGDPAQSYYIPRPWPITDRIWFTLDEMKERLEKYGKGRFYRYINLINI